MPRELPSGADLAASGYRGFNLDIGPGDVKKKSLAGPAENKALEPAEDLESKGKDELKFLAEKRGLTVKRSKGEGEPLKADYIKALSKS